MIDLSRIPPPREDGADAAAPTGTNQTMTELSLSPHDAVPPPDAAAAAGAAADTVALDFETTESPSVLGSPHMAAATASASALFYPPTNHVRRKDSAASSRRNSISSAHSRSSHGALTAGANGPQSKYVAQHLRRASILESRKQRLADRAAHAEKVRLRAAVAKAASRDISASEERALAAAQAREKNLAEIAAACAEEVKRAKAIAETMKERREQELQKMKTQMEERMAEAERRREELRSRAAAKFKSRDRGRSLTMRKSILGEEVLPDVVETKEGDEEATATATSTTSSSSSSSSSSSRRPLTEPAAASKIQWWWRAALRRRAFAEFASLGLTIDGVRETSFEQVTEILSREEVLVATAKVLRICGLKEGEVGSVSEMAAVRTFLSAYLILGHPAQVLSNMHNGTQGDREQVGPAPAPSPSPSSSSSSSSSLSSQPIPPNDLANPQLQDLVGKARDLLISFENILSHLSPSNHCTPPPRLLRSLSEAYAAFHNAFIAWKARDSNSLVEVMVMQFVELDAIWQTVKDSTDGSVDEVYRQSIQENQLKLMVRIKRLAGAQQGKKLVFDAVRRARKARAQKRAGDTKPRVVAEPSMSSETAMGHLGAGEHVTTRAGAGATTPMQTTQTQTLTPPATPSRTGDDGGDEDGPSSAAATAAAVRVDIYAPQIQGLLPDNRVVVHELAIDKEFRIEAEAYRRQQQEYLEPAFRGMRATMRDGDQDAHFFLLLEVAQIIRDKLQRLVKPGNAMHTFIAELLDTDVARRQFATGSFSYEKFFQAMAALLPKLCAPVRDEELRELIDARLSRGHYVDRLEALLSFIDVMLSDYANYLLRLAAPQIVEKAAEYEAKMFALGVEAGGYDLSAAEAAWRGARRKVLAEAARRDPEGIQHPRSRPTADRIYAQMLVDLFTQLGPVPESEIPDMLRLDGPRIARSGRTTRHVVTAGAVLLQCKNILKRDVRVPWKLEASRILHVLEAAESDEGGEPSSEETTVDHIMAALESGRSIPAASKAQLRGLVAKLVTASAEAARSRDAEPREPVLRLLLNRLRGHVLARVAAGSTSEKARATSTAGERLAGLGLAEFVERVRDMVEEMARVGAVDRDAHGVWWDTVAERVEKTDAGLPSPGPSRGAGDGL